MSSNVRTPPVGSTQKKTKVDGVLFRRRRRVVLDQKGRRTPSAHPLVAHPLVDLRVQSTSVGTGRRLFRTDIASSYDKCLLCIARIHMKKDARNRSVNKQYTVTNPQHFVQSTCHHQLATITEAAHGREWTIATRSLCVTTAGGQLDKVGITIHVMVAMDGAVLTTAVSADRVMN